MKTYKSNLPKISLVMEKTEYKKVKITSSKDGFNYCRQFWFQDIEIYESFFILLLNRANNTIGYAKISQGGVAGTVVDIRIISKYATESLSSSVILCHNHPSGNIMPSEADKILTKKVKNALQLFEIVVIDHLIITDKNYFSFADENIL